MVVTDPRANNSQPELWESCSDLPQINYKLLRLMMWWLLCMKRSQEKQVTVQRRVFCLFLRDATGIFNFSSLAELLQRKPTPNHDRKPTQVRIWELWQVTNVQIFSSWNENLPKSLQLQKCACLKYLTASPHTSTADRVQGKQRICLHRLYHLRGSQ